MTYTPANIRQFASTRETSDEVALAIFEIAVEGDEDRMWAAPTPAEITAVCSRAWDLEKDDQKTLNWGQGAHRGHLAAHQYPLFCSRHKV